MADNEYKPRGKSNYRGEMCANSLILMYVQEFIYIYPLPIKEIEFTIAVAQVVVKDVFVKPG